MVLETLDGVVYGRQQPIPKAPADLSRMEILRIVMESEQSRLEHEQKTAVIVQTIAQQAPKVSFPDGIAADTRAPALCEVTKVHGMSDRGVIYRKGDSTLATEALVFH